MHRPGKICSGTKKKWNIKDSEQCHCGAFKKKILYIINEYDLYIFEGTLNDLQYLANNADK